MYQSQLKATGEEISQAQYNVRRAKWAVNEKPWFLAENFIAAANVLKNNRIKLPCDSIMQSDPTKYPPVPIADKKPGRRRVHRIDGEARCGICRFAGHNSKTCDYYESWFEWDNDDHAAFQDAFQDSLGRIDDP